MVHAAQKPSFHHSLFGRIFLWFTTTNVSIIVVVALAGVLAGSGPLRQHMSEVVHRSLVPLAALAVETYEEGGAPLLKSWLEPLSTGHETRVSIFDTDGSFLAGSVPDETAFELLAGKQRRSSLSVTFDKDSTQGVCELQGKRGHYLVSCSVRSPVSMLGLHITPTVLLRLFAITLTAVCLCFWLARHLSRPLTSLQLAAREIARGHFDARVHSEVSRRKDEFGALARDFDSMAERLALFDQSQRRMLGDISHELRSPLTRLNVALELARKKIDDGDHDMFDRIEREAIRLEELIDEVLALTKIRSRNQLDDIAEINLYSLVEGVVEDANFEAQASDKEIVFELATTFSKDFTIEGSEELLRRAFENVLRNALRHTPASTSVEVRLQANDGCELIVRDHGPGVSEDELDRIFSAFYRSSDARERSSGGTGLGLAITREALRLHGGTVSACNHTAGGLEVRMTLPASKDQEDLATHRQSRPVA